MSLPRGFAPQSPSISRPWSLPQFMRLAKPKRQKISLKLKLDEPCGHAVAPHLETLLQSRQACFNAAVIDIATNAYAHAANQRRRLCERRVHPGAVHSSQTCLDLYP